MGRPAYRRMVRAVKLRDGSCVLCGSRAAALEVDHIIPICDGGAVLDRSNCRALCHDCHIMVTKLRRQQGPWGKRPPDPQGRLFTLS